MRDTLTDISILASMLVITIPLTLHWPTAILMAFPLTVLVSGLFRCVEMVTYSGLRRSE
jgi:uncharacterized membrane protein YvlD (DUF360 family)